LNDEERVRLPPSTKNNILFLSFLFKQDKEEYIFRRKGSTQHKKCLDRTQEYEKLHTISQQNQQSAQAKWLNPNTVRKSPTNG